MPKNISVLNDLVPIVMIVVPVIAGLLWLTRPRQTKCRRVAIWLRRRKPMEPW